MTRSSTAHPEPLGIACSVEPASSGIASSTSTPPTSLPDSASMASELQKRETTTATPSPFASKRGGPIRKSIEESRHDHEDSNPDDMLQAMIAENASGSSPSNDSSMRALDDDESRRTRRSRGKEVVYNLAKLSGTDVHGKRASKGDDVNERRRERRRTNTNPALATSETPRTSEEAEEVDYDEIPDSAEEEEEEEERDVIEQIQTQSTAKEPRSNNEALPSKKEDTWSLRGAKTPRRGGKARGLVAQTGRAAAKQQAESLAARSRYSTRNSGLEAETLTTKLSTLSKRGRNKFEKGVSRMSRELRRLQDTKEFAHIDDRPVYNTVWSNGKLVTQDANGNIHPTGPAAASRAAKRAKLEEEEEARKAEEARKLKEEEEAAAAAAAAAAAKKKRVKKWMDRGMYAGQPYPPHPSVGLDAATRKKLATIPDLWEAPPENKTLPFPVFAGLRMLIEGRDFKLPYDICNPLPPGQPKPDQWRQMTRNRFVGDAGACWRKTPHFSDTSTCVCKPEDGCAEDCQNRIMLYECDDTNCNIGRAHCTNRAFADLTERVRQGNKFRVGVEVFKTVDRGYGVRSTRCFEPNQIIMEYTGEIITEEECERRMNEIYKNNECYYLMSFDQNMIIDATTGSAARFVNHSCSPNCRMIKWIVSGQPRMALFAGDNPIMTGDELTYDYNFDPFSSKNVQVCLCGSENCRGVLGPKNTKPGVAQQAAKQAAAKAKEKADAKAAKAAGIKGVGGKTSAREAKKSLSNGVKATKRKIKDLFTTIPDDDPTDPADDEEDYEPPAKRMRGKGGVVRVVQRIKRTLSSASLSTTASSTRGASSARGVNSARGVRGRGRGSRGGRVGRVGRGGRGSHGGAKRNSAPAAPFYNPDASVGGGSGNPAERRNSGRMPTRRSTLLAATLKNLDYEPADEEEEVTFFDPEASMDIDAPAPIAEAAVTAIEEAASAHSPTASTHSPTVSTNELPAPPKSPARSTRASASPAPVLNPPEGTIPSSRPGTAASGMSSLSATRRRAAAKIVPVDRTRGGDIDTTSTDTSSTDGILDTNSDEPMDETLPGEEDMFGVMADDFNKIPGSPNIPTQTTVSNIAATPKAPKILEKPAPAEPVVKPVPPAQIASPEPIQAPEPRKPGVARGPSATVSPGRPITAPIRKSSSIPSLSQPAIGTGLPPTRGMRGGPKPLMKEAIRARAPSLSEPAIGQVMSSRRRSIKKNGDEPYGQDTTPKRRRRAQIPKAPHTVAKRASTGSVSKTVSWAPVYNATNNPASDRSCSMSQFTPGGGSQFTPTNSQFTPSTQYTPAIPTSGFMTVNAGLTPAILPMPRSQFTPTGSGFTPANNPFAKIPNTVNGSGFTPANRVLPVPMSGFVSANTTPSNGFNPAHRLPRTEVFNGAKFVVASDSDADMPMLDAELDEQEKQRKRIFGGP